MDLDDIRKLEKVVDRVAASPRTIAAPHCWFCGKVGSVWFETTAAVPGGSTCDCVKSQEARVGKRPKPRWNPETKCIENLDAETIALNVALGYRVLPVTPVTPIKAKSVTTRPSVTPPTDESVTPETEPGTPVTPAAERMRRMRQRRAKQKDQSE